MEEILDAEIEYECYNCGYVMKTTIGDHVMIACKKCKEIINII